MKTLPTEPSPHRKLAPVELRASVVIPTRNRREKLERCLTALANQTIGDFEAIVVDDGSTDATPQLLADLKARFPNFALRWFRHDEPQGANPSRNWAIRESRGRFIAFLDDDCTPDPTWLEKLLAGFVSDRVAAVTGLVEDTRPTNLFELAIKGTHIVYGRPHATRLVAGNMCVRREFLAAAHLDEDRARVSSDIRVSGRGDEEGLFLRLRAAGYEQHVVPAARVVHDHPYTASTFFRQAYRGGASAARLGYKYHLPPRIELLLLLAAWLALPLAFLAPYGWVFSATAGVFFLTAILYNESVRKKKTPWEIVCTLPLVLAFFHARLAGYLVQWSKIALGRERIERVTLTAN